MTQQTDFQMPITGASTLSPASQITARVAAPRVAKAEVHAAAPALGWYTDNILYAEVWERPELSKRDRSLVTIAALITRNYTAQLTGHFNRALTNGVRPTEIAEVITHLAFYAGWPCAMSAVAVMQQVFTTRSINLEQVTQSINRDVPVSQPLTAQQKQAVAPALAEFTQRVVMGDLWLRSELAPRDRSLVTFTSLLAQGQTDALGDQIAMGIKNGLNERDVFEAITHLAFYVGWATAASALPAVRAAFHRPESA